MKRYSNLRPALATLCLAVSGGAAADGAKPCRVLLTWDADPSVSQAVSWRTEVPTAGSRAQLAPALAGPGLLAEASTVTAESQPVQVESGATVWYHTAKFR